MGRCPRSGRRGRGAPWPPPPSGPPPTSGGGKGLPLVADQPAKAGRPPLSEEQALKGSLDIRLAYIVTGDKEVDDISKAGLEGLSEILRNRTSVEPADPVGLDLEKDEPRLYLLADHLDPAGAVGEGLGGARPLPPHRRHPVHRHARPAAHFRPAGRRQSRPQAPAGRHRDAPA